MQISVRLFAGIREIIGSDSLDVALADTATVADLKHVIAVRFPAAVNLLRRTLVAVNQEFAADPEPIPAGSEVALIPPVSGG